MTPREKELEIEAMYDRNHKDKWFQLSDDEKATYYNKNIWRIEKS